MNHSLHTHISARWSLALKLGEMNLTPMSCSSFLCLLLSFQCAVALNQLLKLGFTSLFLQLQLNQDKNILMFIFQIQFPSWSQAQNLPTLPQFEWSPSVDAHLVSASRPSSPSNFYVKLLKLSVFTESSTWLALLDCNWNNRHLFSISSFPSGYYGTLQQESFS